MAGALPASLRRADDAFVFRHAGTKAGISDLEKEKLIEDAEFYARLHSKTEHSNSIKK